jgi:UDP-N-acetylglucosamine 2-epimerase (non-hydrolysing)
MADADFVRKLRIACIVGTRPEAIKMAPVILTLRRQAWADVVVVATAQHRGMLDQVLDLFGIVPDVDLDLMRPGQSLPDLTARLTSSLDQAFADITPDVVLAQGDTTTVMVAALVAFYRRIPFGHVEAGLRTHDLDNPFPEEMNRKVAGILARWHFAPTESSRRNLLAEGTADAAIHVTGNTVIDALLDVAGRAPAYDGDLAENQRLVLVTSHRRENFGAPLEAICRAVRRLADANPDCQFLFPVHPNPNVRDVAERMLGGHPSIALVAPLDYLPFVSAMQRATLILTDSGGVQEEAPALGKPVLVLREETERPEAVEDGVVRLVGHDEARIVAEAQRLLDDPVAYAAMAKGVSPYGDGHSAARIVAVLRDYAGTAAGPGRPALSQ